ncbi:MAG: hypothetical protein A2418_02830 [Candidatus Brennerbacteria bacterium RIFOXYC1_FULL_41_11]|uniref:Baseplate protein J-like domain-containing protein n=1 Tax=Candidatus Brennerbacteria bacterium RIFOXYD1_FULL_41_16 TaxID=1797529 RepID=A0A1G1XJJ7_9BACT|nr:MAG: hypothetical protein A2391_02585 [Candidatus Brennerbacteria bacterium RIFOXYB1_FULL_41_13]OGY39106.1 MAG: hypothetical protein A2418_02830 [Candidatus Brennerbacteria bacterium RIFOXYC1_FULL_41_11]OGY40263.1 MAG: hypothetical protein A2570_03215 [Candidatus Brennerbacteria bacterium RIFOXYD1_FULL_41_16]
MVRKIVDIKIKKAEEAISPEITESKEAVEEEFLKTITQNSVESVGAAAVKKPRRRTASTKTTKATAVLKKKPTPVKRRINFLKPALVLLGTSLFGVAVYAVGLGISSVNIDLETEKDSLSKNFNFVFKESPSSVFDSGKMLLPLYQFKKSFSYTQKYRATGEGEGSSYAIGEMKIYNENSALSQILIAGTRFESRDKKIFRLSSRVVVPGYKSENGKTIPGVVVAEVQADQPGPDFNLGPGRFMIPAFAGSSRFEKIYGISEQSFSGGASGKIPMVVKADLDSAKEKIIEYAYNTAKDEVLTQAPDNLKLLDKAIQFTPGEVSWPSEGAKTPEFKVSINGELSIFVFDENEVKLRIAERLEEDSNIKTDLKSVSYELFYENPDFNIDDNVLSLSVKVKRNLSAIVDTLEFKQRISGKTIDDFKAELLKLEGVEKIKVSVWPFWAQSVPANIDRIKITSQ